MKINYTVSNMMELYNGGQEFYLSIVLKCSRHPFNILYFSPCRQYFSVKRSKRMRISKLTLQ